MLGGLLTNLLAMPKKVLEMLSSPPEKEESGTAKTEAQPDNSYLAEVNASIKQMKDTAKWLVGSMAALGAILIAGTQLSNLGQLPSFDWMESLRLLVSFLAGLAALLAIALVIHRALSVLTATPKSIAALVAEEKVPRQGNQTKDVQFIYDSNLLEPGETIEAFNAISATLITERNVAEQKEDQEGGKERFRKANEAVGYQNDRIATFQATMRHEAVRRALAASRRPMLIAGVVGGMAIGAFTWAANPPKSDPVIPPFVIPTNAYLLLSEDSQEKWGPVIGEDCVQNTIYVMVLDADETMADVVTVTGTNCDAAQMTVSLDELFPVQRIVMPTQKPDPGEG